MQEGPSGICGLVLEAVWAGRAWPWRGSDLCYQTLFRSDTRAPLGQDPTGLQSVGSGQTATSKWAEGLESPGRKGVFPNPRSPSQGALQMQAK